MKTKFKKSGAAVVISGSLGLGFFFAFRPDAALEGSLVPVRQESFEIKVATVGSLDTANAFHVVSAIRGDRGKIIKIIEDGAPVEKGDVLVEFDPTFFETEIQRLTGEVKSREAIVDYQAQLLKLAHSETEKIISNQQLDFTTARQEYERHQSYIAELEELKKKGYSIASEISQAQMKAAEVESRLKKSETDLARIRKEAVFKIAQAIAELTKAKNETETSRNSLVQARAEFAKTVIRAPTPGFAVLEEVSGPGDGQKHKLRVGDTVWQGQPILYLPDSTSMLVKTQVREVDLHKLRPGQEAAVQVDAYPDTRLTGQLDTIGVLALENSGSPDKNFQFTIRLKDRDARLRPGMTARVSIIVDHVENVPTIPLGALFYENGRQHSYVLDGRKLINREIGVGRRNDDVAEVLSGLSSGERVSLVKP